MDRTSWIGVIACMVLLMGLEITLEKYYPPVPPKPAKHVVAEPAGAPPSAPAAATGATGNTAQAATSAPISEAAVPVAEKLTFLENDAMRLTLTSHGAAIKEVELKKHKEEKTDNIKTGNIVLNEQSHTDVLALSGWPGADTIDFQLKESSANGVVYTANLPGGVTWERAYAFGKNLHRDRGLGELLKKLFRHVSKMMGNKEDAESLVYHLDVTDSLTNTGTQDVTLPAYSLSVGRAEPLRVAGHYQSYANLYLGSGWLASKFHLTTVNEFNPGYVPILGIKTSNEKDLISSQAIDSAPLHWLGAENQFFTVLLTPTADHLIQNAEFRCYNQRDPQGRIPYTAEPDIEASGFFPPLTLPAGKSVALSYRLYAGPKEYDRLNALGDEQGEIMNYGMFEVIILPMLFVLHFFYSIPFVHNYGVAIILLTLLIKGITWPLQSIANHSGKRMQALAPKLKELQAKHKDQPEKLQTETFAMYREYGVNPFGGCLPALVQMPVFFSLYFMLQNAVELRGQSFLWIRDLTQPDMVASWNLPFELPFFGSHLALHLLPIMVTGLTMVMMRMTPQIGDPQQAKIAQFMPLVFLFIFYNFAAALSLYYVINNSVAIVQIYRNLRKPLPELKRKPRK
jgi:YidC/Oxa1 family membrane protein insertase